MDLLLLLVPELEGCLHDPAAWPINLHVYLAVQVTSVTLFAIIGVGLTHALRHWVHPFWKSVFVLTVSWFLFCWNVIGGAVLWTMLNADQTLCGTGTLTYLCLTLSLKWMDRLTRLLPPPPWRS